MSYELEQLFPEFTSFEDIFSASSVSSMNVGPLHDPGHALFDQSIFNKVTEREADSLSSFWCPTYGHTESYSDLDALSQMPLLDDSLGSTSRIEGASNAGSMSRSNDQPRHLVERDDLWTATKTELSSIYLPGPVTGDSLHHLVPSKKGDTSPYGVSLQRPASPFVESSPSPSTSRSLSTAVSQSTKVESPWEDLPSDCDTDDGEYLPPAKYRGTNGNRSPSVRKYSKAQPPSQQHVSANPQHTSVSSPAGSRKRKRADADSLPVFELTVTSAHTGRQRRRNIQISEPPIALSPVPSRGGSYGCPVAACARVMAREQEMRRHIETHLGKGYKCPVCERVYSRIDAARRHLKDVSACGHEAKAKGLGPVRLEA